jgi:hypothetical protein
VIAIVDTGELDVWCFYIQDHAADTGECLQYLRLPVLIHIIYTVFVY